MKVIISTLLVIAFSYVFLGNSLADEIQPDLSISLAPRFLKPGEWGILTLVQIFKGEPSGTATLNEKAIEQRALCAKKTGVLGWVDIKTHRVHRVQVFSLKTIDAGVIELKSEDVITLEKP